MNPKDDHDPFAERAKDGLMWMVIFGIIFVLFASYMKGDG